MQSRSNENLSPTRGFQMCGSADIYSCLMKARQQNCSLYQNEAFGKKKRVETDDVGAEDNEKMNKTKEEKLGIDAEKMRIEA